MRILLTTTSYQDTPGRHHQLLEESGHEVVRDRGPLTEQRMLELIGADGGFDGILHGDDTITRSVIESALPRLRALSKYGIGLDSVDVDAATALKVPVLFTPGVNHTTVAEHTFGLILMLAKHLYTEVNYVKQHKWTRITGTELAGMTMGILGLGRVGKEVAIRAKAFSMQIIAYDLYWDEPFAQQHGVFRAQSVDEVLEKADVLSLHMNLTDENRHLINKSRMKHMKDGVILINCSRGGLINEADVAEACKNGKMLGYGADVLEHEPIKAPHIFHDIDNIVITPHIASRTRQSVERQAVMATENLLRCLAGDEPLAQANKF
ncbi:MAG: 3-phosphoglycerate dehydrogenase [Phycisphaeraceae bacterium]|nr:3-phosphoglycerate dehydrogenase [Phycisphaeraceae bacterium]|tara:strand:+ start:1395 stop:2360 length:966 start_codon:yes stop_codon:yes gene_type:complete